MSQHHFYTEHNGEKTHVLMGWDRPLQGYFLVVSKESDIDTPYWSNLECEDCHPKTLSPFMTKLVELKVPEEMLNEVKMDASQNMANKQVIHRITKEGYEQINNIDPSREKINDAYAKYASDSINKC
jgi:hypothetical protein